MKRNYCLFIISTVLLLIVAISCKKSSNKNSSITTANMSGTFKLKALSWVYGGLTFNVYDSLPACEKDNQIRLNMDLTFNFIDAGVQCNPPLDSMGVWHLSGDSIYFDATPAKIKSFDGQTLILTGYPNIGGILDSTINSTTTLTKL